MMDIIGTIDKIFSNKNDWMAGTFIPDSIVDIPDEVLREQRGANGVFKFSGKHLLDGTKLEKTRVKLSGQWEKSINYGWSLKCDLVDVETTSDVFYFLVNFIHGLGEAKSQYLVKRFGNDRLIDMIENRPRELLEVKGIGPVILERIVSSWNKFSNVRKLSDVLAPARCSANMIYRVFKHFEDVPDFVDKIKENYYILVDVPGLSFKLADKVALSQGIDPMSSIRIKAALVFCVQMHANIHGHTYCDIWDVNKYLKTELEIFVQNDLLENVFQELFDGDKLVSIGDQYVMLRSLFEAESDLFSFFSKRQSVQSAPILPDEVLENFINGLEMNQGFEYNQKQREAIISANTNYCYLVAGLAGTGKTTVAHAIMKLLANKYDDAAFYVTALSGIATDKIKKSTGHYGGTIQSLLVTHQNDRYIPYDVLVIDECGMVPSILLSLLLNKVSDTTVVILIGDPGQLDPVGPGSPFNDLVRLSVVPKVVLDEPNRTSATSAIIKVATDIRRGQFPNDIDDGKEFIMVDRAIKNYPAMRRSKSDEQMAELRDEMYEAIRNTFCDYYQKLAPKMVNEISTGDYHSFLFNYQLITPQRIGPLGSKTFNKVIKETVNKSPGLTIGADFNEMSISDKVVHNTNIDLPFMSLEEFHHDPMDFNPNNTTRVFNGFIGIVIEANADLELMWVYYPLDSKVIVYGYKDVGAFLELGYALTIHKTQGSEYENVFIPMNLVFYRMLNTRLLYTGVTRARSRCIMVGDRYALKIGVENFESSNRFTYFQLLLKGEV